MSIYPPKADLPKVIANQTILISVFIAYMELQLKKDLEKARRIPGYKAQYTRAEIDKISQEIIDGVCSGFSAFIGEQLIGHRLDAIAKELQNIKLLYEHGKLTDDGSFSDDGSAFEKIFKEIGNQAARDKGFVLSEDDFLTRKNPIVEIFEDIFSNIRWLQQQHGIRYIPEEAVYKLTDEQSKAFSALVSKKQREKKAFMLSFCKALHMDSAQFSLEPWSDKEADALKAIYQKGGEEEALRYLNKLLGGTLEKKLRERISRLPQYEWGELGDILKQDVLELTSEQSQAFSKLVSGKEIGGTAFAQSFCKALQIKDAPLRLKDWDYQKATELLSIYQEHGQKQALRYLDKLFDGALEKELKKRKSERKLKHNLSVPFVFKKDEIEETLRKIFLSFEKESSKVIRLAGQGHAVLAYKEKEHYYFMNPNNGALCGPFSSKEAPHEITQLIFEALFSKGSDDFDLTIDIFEESLSHQSKLPHPKALIQELLDERQNKLKNKLIDLTDFSKKMSSLLLSSKRGSIEAIQALLNNGANIAATDKDGCTALHYAAKEGHIAVVEALLAAEADIAATDNDGYTALHWAAEEGHIAVVEALLAAEADIAATDEDGCTALHCAAEKGHIAVVEALLAAEADIAATDNDGYTALHWAAEEGHIAVVEALLAAEADIETKNNDGSPALHLAAKNGHVAVVNLLAAKSDIAAMDKDESTALHWAAAKGHIAVVEALLAAKADIAAKDNDGYTALHLAAKNGHVAVVNLLAAKADIAAKDNDGYTALHWAAKNGHVAVVNLLAAKADIAAKDNDGYTALHWAAEEGHIAVVEALLVAKADIAATDEDGCTALHCAAWGGHVEIVKNLLTAEADIETKNNIGYTALRWAAAKGHIAVVEALLAAEADIAAKDNDGYTALHCAAEKGHIAVVEALLAAKADIAATNNKGTTALHLAAVNGHIAVVKALLAKGAKINVANNEGKTALDLAKNEARTVLLEHQAKQVSDESPEPKPTRRRP